jgi:hypothetical protein
MARFLTTTALALTMGLAAAALLPATAQVSMPLPPGSTHLITAFRAHGGERQHL